MIAVAAPKSKKVASVKLVRKRLDSVLPHEKNPRKHPAPGSPQWNALAASLNHDFFDPLVWNRRNNKLVSGHLRHAVLLANGFVAADMSVVDYDEPTHLARLFAANHGPGMDDDVSLKLLLDSLDDKALLGLAFDDLSIDSKEQNSNDEKEPAFVAVALERLNEMGLKPILKV